MCKDHHLLPHYSEFLTPEEQEAMEELDNESIETLLDVIGRK